MTIVQNSESEQTISFIPRGWTDGNTYTVEINNETTNTQVFQDTSATFTELDYYNQYTKVLTGLTEDTMYNLVIKDGSDIIYKDKLFCTNQTISTYSINNDEYTVQSEDNEFIVL